MKLILPISQFDLQFCYLVFYYCMRYILNVYLLHLVAKLNSESSKYDRHPQRSISRKNLQCRFYSRTRWILFPTERRCNAQATSMVINSTLMFYVAFTGNIKFLFSSLINESTFFLFWLLDELSYLYRLLSTPCTFIIPSDICWICSSFFETICSSSFLIKTIAMVEPNKLLASSQHASEII